TYKLTDDQQAVLSEILRTGNYRPTEVPYTSIAAKTEDCNINLYTSGKLLVQGKGAQEFVEFILEPLVLLSVSVGYEEVVNPELSQPHMGVDESGKGDFFGPMVIAAAYIDETLIDAMRELDVKDSKNITSDKKAMFIGSELRKLLGHRFALVTIGPAAYNRLYSKMRSVNRILAWGHARAIEDLLAKVPTCPKAISDQFGNKETVERALMQKGRGIELIQRHKAESDPAVAAASIIAREAFLRSLQKMGQMYGVEIKKGASAAVREVAVGLARSKSPEVLLQACKCHFKTTDAVLAELGVTRKDLPAEGQVVSKPYTRPPKR
ncbi:MAG: ribonuclease HIII, partial [Verrucomicrobia bacterium]|nr:ribonuclease HIII [Verrucomicrobiota bacterium]